MISPKQSLPLRLARSSLKLALRFWPEESRQWGQALAAELDEIERQFEAVHWALGGLLLFSRASASHFLAWLRLPAGSRLSAASLPLGEGTPIQPKRSRLFTVAVLTATALLLLLPQSRVAISTVRASWQGYELWHSDRRTLEKLATRAEKEKDARTLAFVALTSPEPAHGMVLADRAVALDPGLTWIYASRFYRPDSVPQPVEWLVRLQASDPDNAFIKLLVADAIAYPRFEALVVHRTAAPQEIDAALASDPRWLAQMDAALRAQRYDGYLRQHWDLICYAWNRDPSLSPSVIGYGLWSHQIPNLFNLKAFARFEVHRAQQARAGGHPEQTGKILEGIDSFGTRMVEQGQTEIERLLGLELSRQASQELRTLYAATGQAKEASDASARLQEIEKRQQAFRLTSAASYLVDSQSFLQRAFLFQTCAILLVVCGVIVALSIFLLETRPRFFPQRRAAWQRILCITADYAPASFLILNFVFLVSFLPIAHSFARYRSSGASIETLRELSSTLWTLMQIPLALQKILDPALFWLLLTMALVVIAALLLFRIFARPRPAPRAAP